MTYKDDLISCGELIQDKINAHTTEEVDFGDYTQGKDDFYHMGLAIDNLRGDKDYNVKFLPFPQYIVSNNQFELMVLLSNAFNEVKTGEELTITDSDDSTYTSVTGEDGIAVFTIPEIDDEVIFTVSYGESIVSEDTISINPNQFINDADEELY